MSPRMYFTMPQLGDFPMTCSRSNMLQVICRNSLTMAIVALPWPPPTLISELSPWKMPRASFSTISMMSLLFATHAWRMALLYDVSILAKLHCYMPCAISKGVLAVGSLNHSSRLKNVKAVVSERVKSSTTYMSHEVESPSWTRRLE